MNFYLIKLITNTAGQDGSSVSVYNSDTKAKVAYHNALASLHNASDALYAVVEILDEYGRILGGENGYREEVDHRPEPEQPTE